MVEVRNLSKQFGEHWALKNTSWSVADNRSVGLLGPNGAGKSTTMKIITGLLCATEGEVLIDGESLLSDPIAAKRKIGYLPESPPLYDEMKVIDYLDFVCGLKSVPRKQRASQIDDAIAKLKLNEIAFKPARILSKGFRQRVGIAQALLGEPSILILDEPSVGLDPHQVYELRNIIKALKKDHVIILSTHVLSEVQQICDDIVILDKGEVKTKGALSELLVNNQASLVIELELDRIPASLVGELKSLASVQEVHVDALKLQLVVAKEREAQLNDYLAVVLKNDCQVLAINKKQQQLEDVFIEVTR